MFSLVLYLCNRKNIEMATLFLKQFSRMIHNMPIFLSFIGICCSTLIIISVYELRWIQSDQKMEIRNPLIIAKASQNRLVYAVYGHNIESGYLKHVFEMFRMFGFVFGSLDDEWDVLWAHDYPFTKLSNKMHSLKPHQMVNHFPGTGFITNKLDLATSNIKYIPVAFKIPKQKDQLLSYVKKFPQKMFVQKSNNHRGIKIENVESLDLTADGSFVQEFIDNPLLVDGHKFDIGVYTIITSVEPLRVYIYNGDILFRFCPEKYYPFDKKIINKYVITDDYLPIWQVPSLKEYYVNQNSTMRESFNQHLRDLGRNPDKIWKNIEAAIRAVCLEKEPSLLRLLKRYQSKHNFFEMVRFDFAVDDNLDVYIMEANMSPNLSSAHYPPNRLLYMQVLFNLFSLVGLDNFTRRKQLLKAEQNTGGELHTEMDASLRNIMVFTKTCSSNACTTCYSPECQLCLKCLRTDTIKFLKESYREHNRRHDCKRIFPPTMTQLEANISIHLEHYSPENQLLYNWFRGKCLQDINWC